ncbi:unnamed protein product [Camellia sinensis]
MKLNGIQIEAVSSSSDGCSSGSYSYCHELCFWFQNCTPCKTCLKLMGTTVLIHTRADDALFKTMFG